MPPGEAEPNVLALGLKHHQAGRLAEAEACYRRVLAVQPGNADALHLLGLISEQAGRHDIAVEMIARAIKQNGQNAAYFSNLGTALINQGKLDEGVAAYRQAIAIRPDAAEAHCGLANALRGQGKLNEALVSCDQALLLRPDYAEAHYNRGNALHELKRLEEALVSYDRTLTLRPDYAQAQYNRGLALHKLKRLDEALASYDRFLSVRPDHPGALYNRASALHELGRYDEALAGYDRALSRRPDYAEAHYNRGLALHKLKRLDEALASYDRALSLRSDYAEAHYNRGNVLRETNRLDAALASYDRAISIQPNYANALNNRGNVLRELNRFEEALANYDLALSLNPDLPYALGSAADCASKLCDWNRRKRFAADLSAHISDKSSIIAPFILLGYSGDPALQLQCARNHAENMFPSPPPPLWSGQTWRHGKVRVAYLSPDFRSHPTASLTAELFEQHDRSRYEIVGVSFGADDRSAMRERLVAAFDEFHDVRRQSDAEVAKLLNEQHCDIAVDLAGYTKHSRPGIFAHRPVPIQVSYLGFPATMGADFIDYIIADATVIPVEHQPYYSEKVVYLPDCYQVNDTTLAIAERTPTRREMGLPDHGFVFCCFNNTWKITPELFGIWMDLLRRVEGSVLWLLRTNKEAERNLRREAQQRGIDPSRLVFAEWLPLAEHLARQRLAGLFLDTVPYNAGATAAAALWCGLPVLTVIGDSFVGRMAASLLHAVGMPELITGTLADYRGLALKLAGDQALLAGITAKLLVHRDTYPLFDTVRFTRHIEAAYRTMWENWQRGEAPKSFNVAPVARHA